MRTEGAEPVSGTLKREPSIPSFSARAVGVEGPRKRGPGRSQHALPAILVGVAIVALNVVTSRWHARERPVARNIEASHKMSPPPTFSLGSNISFSPPRRPVEHWEGDADALASAVAKRVAAPWTRRGVREEDTMNALHSLEECFLVQVVGGRVFVVSPHEGLYEMSDTTRIRRFEAVKLLHALAHEKESLPDVEFALCPDDCVTSQRFSAGEPEVLPRSPATARPSPTFTHVACRMSDNLPFHFWNTRRMGTFDDWDARAEKIRQWRRPFPWPARIPRAVFRGAMRRCYSPKQLEPDARSWRTCGRTRLKHLAHTEPLSRRVDVDVGDAPFIDTRVYPRARRPMLPMRQQEAYRYVINVEGNCGWADRLHILAFMGALVLHQETMCKEWYNLAMRPWVHYVPVDYYFDSLPDALRWAENHEADALRIVDNMNALASALLSRRGIRSYTRHLVRAFAPALNYTVRRRPGAEPAEDYFARQRGLATFNRIAAHEATYFITKHALLIANLALVLLGSVFLYHALPARESQLSAAPLAGRASSYDVEAPTLRK